MIDAPQYAMLVVCARRTGLIAAATRLMHFGPPDADLRRRHRSVATIGEYFATATLRETVAAGQAFAWNPSIAGAMSEDTILVTSAGPEVLTETDTFPTIEIAAGGLTLRRPDNLVL